MRATTNPFVVNFSFLGNNQEIVPGSAPELCVSVKNRGDQNVVVDLSIEVTDRDSKALTDWIDPKRVRIAVNALESKVVNFRIEIPDSAWAFDYRYDVILDSLDEYSEYTPLIYPQILKVIPAPAALKHGGEDSAFFLTPATTSSEPKIIKAGETFEVEALIENRTNLVDRYYLVCSDLNPEFFSVSYPEIQNQYGLIVESDGLELNPGKQAKVKIRFHPPFSANAGNYYPTIRLASVNNPRHNLLDIVYLHVPPSYELQLELETIQDRVKDIKTESGEYQLKVLNQGNIERSLLIKGRNRGWGGLNFSIDPDSQTLAPGELSRIQLLVKPIGRWWNRPFYGVGREFKFGTELEDLRGLPLPSELPEGKLTWEPYSKRKLILAIILLSLLGLGLTAAIVFAIWNAFFKLPPTPKIAELAPTKSVFKEANREEIKLNWKIKYGKSVGKVVLTQQGPDGNDVKTFDFKNGIPTDLVLRNPTQTDNYCELRDEDKSAALFCRGISAPARKPGQYQYTLEAYSQKELQKPASVLRTDTIKILPAGLPSITDFVAPQAEYFVGQPIGSTPPVLLSWEVANPTQIANLKLVGIAQDGASATKLIQFDFQNSKIPQPLQSLCKLGSSLLCRNVPMQVTKPGLFTFRLTVEPKQGGESKTLSKTTDAVRIKLIPKPVTVPLRPKFSGGPEGTLPSTNGSKSGQGQSGQNPNNSGQNNGLIEPSNWPPRVYPSVQSRPSSVYRPSTNLSSAYQQSVEQANDVVNGLVVANNSGQIKPNSQTWNKVQDAVANLRRGRSLADAASQSHVSLSLLTNLIAWGQGNRLPAVNGSGQKQGSAWGSNDIPPSGSVQRPPEPLWGNAQPLTGN